MDPRFIQPSTVYKEEETHSGEDVGVFATGPSSHVITLNNLKVSKLPKKKFSFLAEFMSKALSATQWLMQPVWDQTSSKNILNVAVHQQKLHHYSH